MRMPIGVARDARLERPPFNHATRPELFQSHEVFCSKRSRIYGRFWPIADEPVPDPKRTFNVELIAGGGWRSPPLR